MKYEEKLLQFEFSELERQQFPKEILYHRLMKRTTSQIKESMQTAIKKGNYFGREEAEELGSLRAKKMHAPEAENDYRAYFAFLLEGPE